MKNKLKLSLIAIATIVASNTNAQTFYQCMPCPAGTYASNGTCTPCPAGTYSQVTGATSSAVCTACPDYQWSNAGATKCGDVKVKLNLSDYKDASKGPMIGQTSMWVNMRSFSGHGFYCYAPNFPEDPVSGYWGGCGTGNMWVSEEKQYLKLLNDCRRLPCYVARHGKETERRFIINTDGSTTEYWAKGDPNPNGNAGTHKGVVTW